MHTYAVNIYKETNMGKEHVDMLLVNATDKFDVQEKVGDYLHNMFKEKHADLNSYEWGLNEDSEDMVIWEKQLFSDDEGEYDENTFKYVAEIISSTETSRVFDPQAYINNLSAHFLEEEKNTCNSKCGCSTIQEKVGRPTNEEQEVINMAKKLAGDVIDLQEQLEKIKKDDVFAVIKKYSDMERSFKTAENNLAKFVEEKDVLVGKTVVLNKFLVKFEKGKKYERPGSIGKEALLQEMAKLDANIIAVKTKAEQTIIEQREMEMAVRAKIDRLKESNVLDWLKKMFVSFMRLIRVFTDKISDVSMDIDLFIETATELIEEDNRINNVGYWGY